jgi:SOS response regulatory protein OraA/RecX
MGKKTTRELAPPPSDEELTEQLLRLLGERALTKAELGKKLPKRDAERAFELARELARQGTLHRVAKAKSEIFYSEDPVARLDRLGPELLRREGPLNSTRFKASIKAAAPNHDGIFAEWLKTALARQLVFERSKPKTYAAEPPPVDLKLLLKKPLAELTKLLPALEQKGVSRERIADFLRAELGSSEPIAATTPAATTPAATTPASATPASATPASATAAPATTPFASGASREVFLDALRRLAADNPKGALLPVRELRERAGLAKQDFDAAALALSREGLLVLHYHDHAASLSEADQNALVRDTLGRHYIGVALRGSA